MFDPRVATVLFLLFSLSQTARAQVRERPVAFDDAGRITVITPPLAARLGLSRPDWPAAGDYVDARLYAANDANTAFVLVVRREHGALERFMLTGEQRLSLATIIARSGALAATGPGGDLDPTNISEPVRGSFVVNQTLLGAFLFGPAASAAIDDASGSTAAYLAVTGASFFLAANISKTTAVSRAQNHLAWHSARRGAIASDLLTYSLTGSDRGGQGYATAALLGGIAGDVLGFTLAEPMTDGEAHATSHGSTVTAALVAGLAGSAGSFDRNGNGRAASALIVGAGVLGYPLGLRYARAAPYRVTAGDVGTLVTSEFLGMAAAAALIPQHGASNTLVYSLLTSGFAIGALAGDRLLVRPFDHTESEARLLQYGTLAGAVVAIAVPVLAQSNNPHVLYGAAAAGGILGAVLTEQLIEPARSRLHTSSRSSSVQKTSRMDVHFAPESAVLAGMGLKGNHSVLTLTF